MSLLKKLSSFSKIHHTRFNSDNHESTEKVVATIGITDYAQRSLGDLVYVELPKVGKYYEKAELLGVVESVKGASDVYAPISGTIQEVNQKAGLKPSLINTSPMDKGWLCKMTMEKAHELRDLISEGDYRRHCQQESD